MDGWVCAFIDTASLLVAVVRAVIVPVAHLAEGDTVSVVTSELSRGAGGCGCVAHVLQLIRLVPTVIVAIADKVMGHTAAILAGELVLLARLVGAALLITAVPTIITSITPVGAAYAEAIATGELIDAAGSARAVLMFI